MTDELLTSADLRRILGVGQNAVTRYLRTLRHLRLGNPRTGPVRVLRSDLEAWMERRMVTPEEEHDPEAVRPRQSVPTRQRRAVDRPPARRPRRLPVPVGDGPGGRPPAPGGGTPGAGPDTLRFPSRRGKAA